MRGGYHLTLLRIPDAHEKAVGRHLRGPIPARPAWVELSDHRRCGPLVELAQPESAEHTIGRVEAWRDVHRAVSENETDGEHRRDKVRRAENLSQQGAIFTDYAQISHRLPRAPGPG